MDSNVTAFLHAKLDVADMARAIDFYCGKLGCREIVRYKIPMGEIVQISPTGRSPGVELWYESDAPAPRHSGIHIAFAVSNTRALVENLRAAGVEITREPFEMGDEIIAFVRDPDGYEIELNQNDKGQL